MYLSISCSLSSSSFCRWMTDSMICLSSSVRWERSGIGGSEGRLATDMAHPQLPASRHQPPLTTGMKIEKSTPNIYRHWLVDLSNPSWRIPVTRLCPYPWFWGCHPNPSVIKGGTQLTNIKKVHIFFPLRVSYWVKLSWTLKDFYNFYFRRQ